MNNFRYMARKWHRDTLERNIIYNLKSAYPGLEQHISSHRYPVLPKIVLYSSAASSESFLRKYLPSHAASSPSTRSSPPAPPQKLTRPSPAGSLSR
jgi:hypothetical protein